MSERLMQEFRERAERLIPLPDLDELRRRGAARRRVRLAAGAAVLASALAIGGIVVATTIGFCLTVAISLSNRKELTYATD